MHSGPTMYVFPNRALGPTIFPFVVFVRKAVSWKVKGTGLRCVCSPLAGNARGSVSAESV